MKLNFYRASDPSQPWSKNFSLLVAPLDDWESFKVVSDWVPPAVEPDGCYDMSLEFEVTYEVVKRGIYKDRPFTEIEVVKQPHTPVRTLSLSSLS